MSTGFLTPADELESSTAPRRDMRVLLFSLCICMLAASCDAGAAHRTSPVPQGAATSSVPLGNHAVKMIDVSVPKPLGHVSDFAHLLSDSERAALDTKLRAHEARTGQQFAVTIWNQPLGTQSIGDLGFTIANQWKLGRTSHDDGVLVVLAPTERKVDIEVGLGLERVLNDELCARVIAERMAPKFRNGKYASGLQDGFDKLIEAANATVP